MNTSRPSASRRGITLFELLVAFSILAVIVSVSSGLLVRSGRLLVSARNQRIAIDELADAMERLLALPDRERDAFLAAPLPSGFASAHLPGASLTAAVDPPAADAARRVVLALEWDEPGRRGHPLRLAGWIPASTGEVTP